MSTVSADTKAGSPTEAIEPVELPSGPIVAALLAAMIGLWALAIANIWANADAGFKNAITLHKGIGPYSGKELISWGVWLGSWAVLHFTLRNRTLELRRWLLIFAVGMLAAVVLVYPPVFELFA